MATRLPTPGGDSGQWGQILNDFLSVAHADDGSLKPGAVTAAALSAGSVTSGAIQDGAVTQAKLDAGLNDKVNTIGATSLAGDASGPVTATVVSKVNGITITGTPAVGQVLKATSTTEASWGTDDTSTFPARTVVSRNANATATNGEYIVTTGAITITLPAAESGAMVSVKKTDADTVLTVATPGSETIDGGADDWTATTQWASEDFVSDGTNWFTV